MFPMKGLSDSSKNWLSSPFSKQKLVISTHLLFCWDFKHSLVVRKPYNMSAIEVALSSLAACDSQIRC